MPTKEEIYDEQINPLMAQIIAICKEHNIAHVCSFSLDDDGLMCTTCNTSDETDPPDELRECVRLLHPDARNPLMLTVEKADGSKEIHAIL